VYTVDAARSWATTVAVRNGLIVYVGSDSLPAELVGPSTEVVDLAGRMVLPGFQDAHVHPVEGGVELGECLLFDAGTAKAAVDAVRAYAAAHPDLNVDTGNRLAVSSLSEREPVEGAAGSGRAGPPSVPVRL
jgi:predicted amidohydrolase YtcJ